jgi:hypothetical protein
MAVAYDSSIDSRRALKYLEPLFSPTESPLAKNGNLSDNRQTYACAARNHERNAMVGVVMIVYL